MKRMLIIIAIITVAHAAFAENKLGFPETRSERNLRMAKERIKQQENRDRIRNENIAKNREKEKENATAIEAHKAKHVKFEKGSVGEFPPADYESVRSYQVIGSSDMLAKIVGYTYIDPRISPGIPPQEFSRLVWITGMPTENIADNMVIDIKCDSFECVGTKTYPTPTGTSTVFMFRPVQKKVEASIPTVPQPSDRTISTANNRS